MRAKAWILFPAVAAILSGTAQAAPTIAVTSPPPGQPLYNVQPTITIAYSSAGAPLDLTSLAIHVNGSLWTARFTVGAASATYAVSAADALVAGRITISAQIRDQATPPVSASVMQEYDLFPTFQAVTPTVVAPGDTMTLRGLGLDPLAARNQALFPNAFGAAIIVPFDLVRAVPGDPIAREGTVVVPQGTASGFLKLIVNAKEARERLPFQIQPPVTYCGATGDFRPLSDGGSLVYFRRYLAGLNPSVDARCPALPFTSSCTCGGGCVANGAVAHITPEGGVTILRQDRDALCPSPYTETIRAIAVDKGGLEAVLTTVRVSSDVYQLRILYRGRQTSPTGVRVAAAADFDPEGNLYLAATDSPRFRVWEVTRQQLALGGNVTPRLVSDGLGLTDPAGARLVVGCDGYGYLAVWLSRDYGVPYDSVLLKLDLQTGAILDSTATFVQEVIVSLSLTCHTGELWGTTTAAQRVDVWRAEVSSDPHDIGPLQVERTWPAYWISDEFPAIGIPRNGEVRVAYVPYSGSSLGVAPNILTVPGLHVTPCPNGSETTALPLCATGLILLPQTTRWRPQRSTAGVVEVHFAGPPGLTPATTLEITSPEGTLTNQNLAFEVVDGESDPALYKITWSGPWTRTDPVTGLVGPLPAGNHRVVVRGVMSDDSIVTSSPSDVNSTVSLVEVTGVELLPDTDDPRPQPLTQNPALPALAGQRPPQDRPGVGKRILAEAQSGTGPVLNKVLVRATIAPTIADLRGQAPIAVYFRSFDVDDPARVDPENGAPNFADADLDHFPGFRVDDNRGTPKQGTLSPGTVAPGPGQAQVVTTFTTSLQPGDNYRILATTSPEWRDTIRAYQPNQTGELCRAENEPCLGTPLTPEERRTVSEMLTVWRTLHLETDSMPAPPLLERAAERNFIVGNMVAVRDPRPVGGIIRPTRLELFPDMTEPPVPLPDGSPDLSTETGNGRFEHGAITVGLGPEAVQVGKLDGNGFLHVQRNAGIDLPFRLAASGRPALKGFVLEWEGAQRFVVDISIPPGTYGGGTFEVAGGGWTVTQAGGSEVLVLEDQVIRFRLEDDDAAAPPFQGCGVGGSAVSFCSNLLRAVSDDPTTNILAQAYIQIAYDLPGTGRTPPFKRHLPTDLPTLQQQLDAGRDATTRSTPSYWAMYLQAAFQWFAYERVGDNDFGDGDPDLEFDDGQFHGATGSFDDAFGSLVFVESIHDFSSHGPCNQALLISEVMAHELGHQFGLTHFHGGIMTIDAPCGISHYHSGISLNEIRWKGLVHLTERRSR